jgi:hypothetical protein
MLNFITEHLPDGTHKFTLATIATNLWSEAEDLYGITVSNYTYGGIELHEGGPLIMYYGKFIIIRLSVICGVDLNRAKYQIAHEVVHLLSPTGEATASILEEGLATHFSMMIVKRDAEEYYYDITLEHLKGTAYYQPYLMMDTLLKGDSDIIKKLRLIEPIIRNFTSATFEAAGINLPSEFTSALCEPMQY